MKYLRQLLSTPFLFLSVVLMYLGAVIHGDGYGVYLLKGFGVSQKDADEAHRHLKSHL